MSLDKAIEHQKERRKPYRGAKSCDSSCRNHGSCDYCRNARLFSRTKAEARWASAEKDYFEEKERANVL